MTTIGVASVLLSLPDTSAVTTIGVASMLLPLPGRERRGDDWCSFRAPPLPKCEHCDKDGSGLRASDPYWT